MKVAELKAALEHLDDDLEIILQRDPEGNGYSPLAGADPDAVCTTDERGRVEQVYETDWSADDCCLEEDEWAEIKKRPRSVILWPTY